MVENVTRIINGISANIGVSVKLQKKHLVCVEKAIFGILLHVVVKMVNMQEVLLTIQWLRVMKLKIQQKQFQQKQFQQILIKRLILNLILIIIALLRALVFIVTW